jgi:N utilization substance protein A
MLKDEFLDYLLEISNKHGLDDNDIIKAIEKAIQKAWELTYGPGYNIFVDFKNKDLKAYRTMKIVDQINDPKTEQIGKDVGKTVNIPIDITKFSKASLSPSIDEMQKEIEDVKKKREYEDFKDKKDKLFTCVIEQIRGTVIIVKLGKSEGIIPSTNWIRRTERFTKGEQIKCLLIDIKQDDIYQLIFDRKSTKFIRKLLEDEIPEIASGVLEVVSVVRDAGNRAKVLVKTNDPSINPVSVCIGFKKNRLSSIQKQLHGEMIEFINWKEDFSQQILSSFSNKKINKIIIDEENNSVLLVVPDEFVPQIIGGGGKNIRLINQLLKTNIKVVSTSDYEKETEEARLQEKKVLLDEGFEESEVENIFSQVKSLDDLLEKQLFLDEDLAVKVKNYRNKMLSTELENFVKAGGSTDLFLYNNCPIKTYYSLLEAGIKNKDDLFSNDIHSLCAKTGLDRNICAILLKED